MRVARGFLILRRVFRRLGGSIVVLAAALVTLAAPPVLPAAQSDTTKLPTAVVVPTVEKPPEPSPKANKKIEDPASKRLVIDQPPPEKPPPAPEPAPEPARDADRNSDENPDQNPAHSLQAGVASVPVLPGQPARGARTKRPSSTPPQPAITESRSRARDNRLLLSVPRLGLKDISLGDSPDQAYLDREGAMHLSGTGFPYERGSNTYIAGHADYDASRIPSVFRNLKDLQPGDHIILRDAVGRTYDYRVYERLVVTPLDVWVTKPVAGKKIVSLQTCFPAPTFEKRLIVRGELVK